MKKLQLLDNFGIKHQRTVVYCPEQNGKVERENRTIVEATRTMLYAADMDHKFWAEAVNNAVFTLNCVGSSRIPGKTPYEIWFNKKPDIRELHIFGEEVYVHLPKVKREHKLSPKGREGIFLGYDNQVKGYRISLPENKKVIIERNVIFTNKLLQKEENDYHDKIGLFYLPDELESLDNPTIEENSNLPEEFEVHPELVGAVEDHLPVA